jgi:hypothetical protein
MRLRRGRRDRAEAGGATRPATVPARSTTPSRPCSLSRATSASGSSTRSRP